MICLVASRNGGSFIIHEDIARQAIRLYLNDAKKHECLGHSDKLVYKVESDQRVRYVLSVYFPKDGIEYYNENIQLYSKRHVTAETNLLLMLAEKSDLGTARPVNNLAGEYISYIDIEGYPESIAVTMATFVEGVPMDEHAVDYPCQAYAAGVAVAVLHDASCSLPDAASFGFPERGASYVREILAQIAGGDRSANNLTGTVRSIKPRR